MDETQKLLGVDRAKIYQFSADGSGDVVAEARQNEHLPSLLQLHFPATDIPQGMQRELLSEQFIVAIDVDNRSKFVYRSSERSPSTPVKEVSTYEPVDDCYVQYLTTMGVRSSLTIPIVHKAVLWGLIAIHHCQPRRYTERELDTLRLVSKEISLAINKAELTQQVSQQQRQEALARQLETIFFNTPDLADASQQALAVVGETLQAEAGWLYIAEDLTGSLPQHQC